MMQDMKTLLLFFGIYILLIFGLSKVNVSVKKRYYQLWTIPALILLLGFVQFYVSKLDILVSMLPEQFQGFIDDTIFYRFVLANSFLLAAFLALKIAVNFITMGGAWLYKQLHKLVMAQFRKNQKENLAGDQSLEERVYLLFYKKFRGKIYIEDSFLYLSGIFKWAYRTCAVLYLLALVLFYYKPGWGLPSFFDIVPFYISFPLLFCAETSWLLQGERKRTGKESISGGGISSQIEGDYSQLQEEYIKLWPQRLLDNFHLQNEKSGLQWGEETYFHVSEDKNVQWKLMEVFDRLKAKGVRLSREYSKAAASLLEGKNLIIESSFMDELGWHIFSAVNLMLLSGKRILVLCEHMDLEKVTKLFEEWLSRVNGGVSHWYVHSVKSSAKMKYKPDILVASPDLGFREDINGETGEMIQAIDTVIVVDAGSLASKYPLEVSILSRRIEDMTRNDIQIVCLSKWYNGLDTSLAHIFSRKFGTIVSTGWTSGSTVCLAWKSEGKEWFQKSLFQSYAPRYLGAETVLALPALKAGVGRVKIVLTDSVPWREFHNEMKLAKGYVNQYLGFDYYEEDIDKRMEFHTASGFEEKSMLSFVIADDSMNNLPRTLRQWYFSGVKSTFVNILAMPYLLRDYFADNLEYFVKTPSAIDCIVPVFPSSMRSEVVALLLRMIGTGIPEQEIMDTISKLGVKAVLLEDGLNELVAKALGQTIKVQDYMMCEETRYFDSDKEEFHRVYLYQLLPAIRERLRLGIDYMDIIDKTDDDRLVGRILRSHVYQSYIPGQYHVFNGNYYRVDEVDEFDGKVKLVKQSMDNYPTYRQNREYHIEKMAHTSIEDGVSWARGGYTLDIVKAAADFSVETQGYFAVSRGMGFSQQHCRYIDLNTNPIKEQLHREYKNGNLLMLRISSDDITPVSAAKISFTLSVILNELLYTLLPGLNHLAAVCSGHRLEGGCGAETVNLELLMPTLTALNNSEELKDIEILIFEDAGLETGILDTLKIRYAYILQIIEDYLYWTIETYGERDKENGNESGEKKSYLNFGGTHIPDCMDLEATLEVVSALIDRQNSLKECRIQFVRSAKETAVKKQEEHICDFCGTPLPGFEFERLEDGRERCRQCANTTVSTEEQYRELYDKVRSFMVGEFNISLRKDMKVQFVDAKRLHELSGREFIPTPGYDPRAIGVAQLQDEVTMLIENGAPRSGVLSTLAHELTHVWQHDNLNMSRMSLELVEGHASWAEVYYLEKSGELVLANVIRQSLMQRQDEYGTGYRLVGEMLKQKGYDSPFAMFRDMFPRQSD